MSLLELLSLGEEHAHSHLCACLFHLLTELVGGSAGGADVVNEQDFLSLEEVLVNPHIVLCCMFTTDMHLFSLADYLDMLEAVDGITHLADVGRKTLEPASVGLLTTGRDADNNCVRQVHWGDSPANEP